MSQYKVFISHFNQEQPLADAIKEVVKRAFVGHVKVFVSSDIPKGTNWLTEVRDRLQESDEVLTIFSFGSAERPWLNIETGFGVMSGKPVTPILFSGFLAKDLSTVYQLQQSVELTKREDVSRLYSDIQTRVRKKNPNAECVWQVAEFLENWMAATSEATGKVPLTAKRVNAVPVIWLMGSQSDLNDPREHQVTMQVCSIVARICITNRFQIVSGTSRMLEYLADEYENYREYFNEHPEELANTKGEPLRKALASEHAMNAAAAPNPIILLGSLRHKGARATFDDAIGRIPDIAILIGGQQLGRSSGEQQLANEACIPLLPIRFTGGAAASVSHTLNPTLNDKVEKLQMSAGRVDEMGKLFLELILSQIQLSQNR